MPMISYTPERFKKKTTKGSGGCWLWSNGAHNAGYGKSMFHSKPILAHRLSWILHYGSIPDGLYVLHHCDVRRCVNPKHLFLGTREDNFRDMRHKNRHAFGSKMGTAKLQEKDVKKIRSLFHNMRTKDLAAKFNVTASTIHFIVTRKTWRHVP